MVGRLLEAGVPEERSRRSGDPALDGVARIAIRVVRSLDERFELASRHFPSRQSEPSVDGDAVLRTFVRIGGGRIDLGPARSHRLIEPGGATTIVGQSRHSLKMSLVFKVRALSVNQDLDEDRRGKSGRSPRRSPMAREPRTTASSSAPAQGPAPRRRDPPARSRALPRRGRHERDRGMNANCVALPRRGALIKCRPP